MGSRNKGNIHTFDSAVKLNDPIPFLYLLLAVHLVTESYRIQKTVFLHVTHNQDTQHILRISCQHRLQKRG